MNEFPEFSMSHEYIDSVFLSLSQLHKRKIHIAQVKIGKYLQPYHKTVTTVISLQAAISAEPY